MGRVVFPDEQSVEFWVWKLGEEDVHQFTVDMFSLFLLADPKNVTISQGLQQTAAAVMAKFSSINLATIDLSYDMHFPPLHSLEETLTQSMDGNGNVWGPSYSFCDIFRANIIMALVNAPSEPLRGL